MQKPNGYDDVQASGEFTPVKLGGHYCIIKQVTERKTSEGKDQIVVLFDFCSPDEQPNYFSTQYENDTRSEKKWPFNGSKYIMVKDFEDPNKTSRQFKTFCTCVEKSNNYDIKWGGSNWSQQFKGKKIGAVYGEEENEYNGRTSMRHLPRYFCNIEGVKTAGVPEPRYLRPDNKPVPVQATLTDDFINVPDGDEVEIPF